MGFPPFALLIWYINYIDHMFIRVHMLDYPCTPGINPTWLWYIILQTRGAVHFTLEVNVIVVPACLFHINLLLLREETRLVSFTAVSQNHARGLAQCGDSLNAE